MRVTLYVDNGTDADVVARVEGGDALAVPAHEFRAATLPAGARQVTVREVGSGRPVEDLRFVGERDGLFDGHRYVLNVAGANRYGVYQTHYGDTLGVGLGAPDKAEPIGYREHLFALPDDAPFMEPFPATVTVEKSSFNAATLSRVLHRPIHPDRPCCARVR